jgi:hypothetical protein
MPTKHEALISNPSSAKNKTKKTQTIAFLALVFKELIEMLLTVVYLYLYLSYTS